MEAPQALHITRALLRKTVANGCTPSEAAAAAERAVTYMRRFGFTTDEVARGCRTPEQDAAALPPQPAAPRPEPFNWWPLAKTIGCVVGGVGVLCACYLTW